MADNSAEYEIKLRDLFSGKLDQIEKRMNEFENKVNSTGNIAAGVLGGLALAQAAKKFLGYIEDATTKVIELGTGMEKTRITFTTLFQEGSVFANMMISSFQKFAQATPFSTKQVLEGAKMLTAYRYEAQEIIPVMRQLGDISAGLGLDFKDVVWLVGHTKSIGHMDRRILREFTLRGIGIDEAIEKTKGISHKEFERQIHDRMILYKDVAKAIEYMTGKEGQFYNLSEKLSKSVSGRWERLKDTLEIIGTRMGEQLNPELAHYLDMIEQGMRSISDIKLDSLVIWLHAIEDPLKNISRLIDDIFNRTTIGGKSPANLWDMFVKWDDKELKKAMAAWDLFIMDVRIKLAEMRNIGNWDTDAWLETTRLGQIRDLKLRKLQAISNDQHGFEVDWSGKSVREREQAFIKMYIKGKKNSYDSDEEGAEGAGIEKISSATRYITVNITKLIETVNFTKSYEQDEGKLREMITRALVSEVNNVNIAAQ